MHVGFLEQIGRGFPRGDAGFDNVEQLLALILQQSCFKPRVDVTHRQMQGLENEKCRFIDDACGAVAVHQFCSAETRHGVAQEIPGGGEFGGHWN